MRTIVCVPGSSSLFGEAQLTAKMRVKDVVTLIFILSLTCSLHLPLLCPVSFGAQLSCLSSLRFTSDSSLDSASGKPSFLWMLFYGHFLPHSSSLQRIEELR